MVSVKKIAMIVHGDVEVDWKNGLAHQQERMSNDLSSSVPQWQVSLCNGYV